MKRRPLKVKFFNFSNLNGARRIRPSQAIAHNIAALLCRIAPAN